LLHRTGHISFGLSALSQKGKAQIQKPFNVGYQAQQPQVTSECRSNQVSKKSERRDAKTKKALPVQQRNSLAHYTLIVKTYNPFGKAPNKVAIFRIIN